MRRRVKQEKAILKRKMMENWSFYGYDWQSFLEREVYTRAWFRGKPIEYWKNYNRSKKWMKRFANKKLRKHVGDISVGNKYKRVTDFWYWT